MKSFYCLLLKKEVINKLILLLSIFIFSFQNLWAQYPPLGRSWSFSVFTTTGAVNNTGNTVINNDVGTNAGAINGFPPGIIYGETHNADSVTAMVALAVDTAYDYLVNMSCDSVLAVGLGNGQILNPGVYCIGAASTLTDTLFLDAQGDPDALFIFQINGAFTTATYTTVVLLNSAEPCNVFWQVNGMVSIADYSVFKGTVIAEGAISLLEGTEVEGRIFSIPGEINLTNNYIDMPCSEMFLSDNVSIMSTNCDNGIVVLHWSLVSENPISQFIIEKSNDKKSWEAIGLVKNANNNTQSYFFKDEANKESELLFYKVSYTLMTGTSGVVGEIKHTDWCNVPQLKVNIFPNPTNGSLNFVINENEVLVDNVTIYNSNGISVYKSNTASNIVDMSLFADGIYVVYVGFGSQFTSHRIIVAH
jgi:hypothetical protein